MEKVFNWGMYPSSFSEVKASDSDLELKDFIDKSENLIARGNGRCYGDSALQHSIFSTLLLNKVIDLNIDKGLITCEAGILLSDVLEIIVPKGFFLPVTPGTKYITIGGAIASNVHGKNHHKEGSFSNYVESLVLINEKAEKIQCSLEENSELFQSTLGGMGLTGVIVEATIKLKAIETSYIKLRSIKTNSLEETLKLFHKHNHYTYSVAWIDCLKTGKNIGRSVIMLGEHAALSDLEDDQSKNPLKIHRKWRGNIPFTFPQFVLNKIFIKLFNTAFYQKHFQQENQKIVHYEPFFYPLDSITNWNRIYGKKGFLQYQFVLPFEKGEAGMRQILNLIVKSGAGSFLAVLKTFGEEEKCSSSLSFPTPGYTLALDFKYSKKVLDLLNRLDEIVASYGGKIYLSKDARMSSKIFKITYPTGFHHPEKFSSLQSQRLEI